MPRGHVRLRSRPASKERTLDLLRYLDQQCEVRGPLIRGWASRGNNSQNKLNRRIAEADARLRPIVAVFDEIQELITDPELGKAAVYLLTSIVKRGRSLGIHLILSTQRIDKETVPKGISSNMVNRLGLAVQSHIETDLVLGHRRLQPAGPGRRVHAADRPRVTTRGPARASRPGRPSRCGPRTSTTPVRQRICAGRPRAARRSGQPEAEPSERLQPRRRRPRDLAGQADRRVGARPAGAPPSGLRPDVYGELDRPRSEPRCAPPGWPS